MTKRLLLLVMLFAAITSTALAAGKKIPKQPPKGVPTPWRTAPVNDLKIVVERSTDKMDFEQVAMYGTHAAVWNDTTQFVITTEQLSDIFKALDAAGFGKLRTVPEGEHLRRRVRLRAGTYEREVTETWEVEQERKEGKGPDERSLEKQGKKKEEERAKSAMADGAKLEKLVDAIFAIVTPLPEKSLVTADSLSDGLKKIASGTLAPETLSLVMMVKPELGTAGKDGFLLRLDGGVATSSEYLGEQRGFGDPSRKVLSTAALRELASKLSSFEPEDLPVNLYAIPYEELTIRVMGRKKSVTARKFAGLTPEKHGASQKRFDAMSAWLQGTQRQWFRNAASQ